MSRSFFMCCVVSVSIASTYQIELCRTGMQEYLLHCNHHAYMMFRVDGTIKNTVSFGKKGQQVRIDDDYVEPDGHRVILSSTDEDEAAWQEILDLYNSEGSVKYHALKHNCSKIASRVLDHYGDHDAAAWIKSQNSTANHIGSAAALPLLVIAKPTEFCYDKLSIDIGKCVIS